MKRYNAVTTVDGYEEKILICELTAEDVVRAEKEFALYMQSKGKTYDLNTNKCPNIRNFFKLYFGECEYDMYFGDCWTTPDRYICSSEDVADRFMGLARQLNCHNTYNQTFCTVVQDGRIIDVVYGDY